LWRGEWKGFGPTFTAEKLEKLYGIDISAETLRQIGIAENIYDPKHRKIKHRRMRERKPYFGEMVQIDASQHKWFENRGEECALITFIDDATNTIYWEFAPVESTASYMIALHNYAEKYGLPKTIYSDHHSVFKVNVNNQDGDKITQFGRALDELDIEIIFANSPQAKGRVERSHKTAQDRLVKEFRIAGISTINEANRFLKTYTGEHNKRFAFRAQRAGDLHRTLDEYKLKNILCLKEKRAINQNFTIVYRKGIFQLDKYPKVRIVPGDSVWVHEHFDGKIELFFKGIKLYYMKLASMPVKETVPEEVKPCRQLAVRPAKNHPWKRPLKRREENMQKTI